MAKKDDLDFENFSVPTERAQEIRGDLQRLKEAGWIDDLKLLVTELGAEDAALTASLGSQMELLDSSAKPKVYRAATDSAIEGFQVIQSGLDLWVRFKDRTLLEIVQLPKGGDYLVLHVEPALWEALPALREHLAEDLKTARKMKTDRQSHFKAFR